MGRYVPNAAPEQRLLNEDALAQLRALSDANLPHLLTISVAGPSVVVREGGAVISVPGAPVVLYEDEPCRLVAMKAKTDDRLAADQAFDSDVWELVCQAGVVLPKGAEASVIGVDARGAQWTRTVVIGLPTHSRAYEIQSRYSVRDLNVAGE